MGYPNAKVRPEVSADESPSRPARMAAVIEGLATREA